MRSSSVPRRLLAALVTAVAAVAVLSPAAASAAPTSGWNDWSCRPSAAHPEPVVLGHGLGANGVDNFLVLAPALKLAGYCVYSTTYGGTTFLGDLVGGLGDMRQSARDFGAFVERVRSSTGAAQVNVVGHSEGTTVPAYYAKVLGGAPKVKRFVGFGANYRGTTLSGLGTLAKALKLQPVLDAVGCQACSQFLQGSDFLNELNTGGTAAAPGPVYTNIVTKYDTVVTPYTSGFMNAPNATDLVLQKSCPVDFSGHVGLAVDPNLISLVINRLAPEHAPRPICVPYWALGA
ncbi:esterase/lipase family protein [Patulibacter defluvii]|uniref:esterase/lipase family protein n=1 Tax=Patulibacter defluvii TaxID=3095358 RepID=UPI002A7509DD|nr:alpha/beta fold hydrolase [Patulibacter sp. DM4]